jgi:hypothetical protein
MKFRLATQLDPSHRTGLNSNVFVAGLSWDSIRYGPVVGSGPHEILPDSPLHPPNHRHYFPVPHIVYFAEIPDPTLFGGG